MMFSFSLISIFIFVVSGFIIFRVLFGFINHGRMMNQMTDQVFRQMRQTDHQQPADAAPPAAPEHFACQKCGASLDSDTEISPSGDFKCEYCDSWNNVHRRS